MKNLGYNILKYWLKIGLYCYYSKIVISGEQHIPVNKPILFLPNHQSALLDVLLVGIHCNRKPWFLTRSDVFKKPLFKKLFTYLQMIPIYRIRDGRESLKNNDAVFKQCAQLLERGEAILMFPEANHNIKRRVRPLSKGFTRILFGTLNQAPELDIQLVPVGLNYNNAEGFPDRVAIIFGKPIAAKNLYDAGDIRASTTAVKKAVAERLKTLTTHIENEETYAKTLSQLDAIGVDYLDPKATNATLQESLEKAIPSKKKTGIGAGFGKVLFTLLNLPPVLLWRWVGKPKVWEPEFMGTLRYAFALLVYPLYYALVFALASMLLTPLTALVLVLGLFVFNLLYVRLAK